MALREHGADGSRLAANLSARGQLSGHPTLTALPANHQALLGQQQVAQGSSVASSAATHTVSYSYCYEM